MAITTALVTAVLGIAATAYSAYSAIESAHDKPSTPYDMGVRETPDTSAADVASASEAARIRKRRAMASTIKTSAEGLTEAPTVGKQTLGD